MSRRASIHFIYLLLLVSSMALVRVFATVKAESATVATEQGVIPPDQDIPAGGDQDDTSADTESDDDVMIFEKGITHDTFSTSASFTFSYASSLKEHEQEIVAPPPRS